MRGDVPAILRAAFLSLWCCACGAPQPATEAPAASAPPVQPTSGAPSCDASAVICDALPPTCSGESEVPSVIGSCWGPCVRVIGCACDEATSCPYVLGHSETCYHGHCGPWLR